MSTPASEKVPPAPAPSEELFDELDSLLQRMLALPVNQPDGVEGARPADGEEDEDDLPDVPLITIAEASLDPAAESSIPQSPLSVSQEPFYQSLPEQAPEEQYRPPTVPPPPISIRSEPKKLQTSEVSKTSEVSPPPALKRTDPDPPSTSADEPPLPSWKTPFVWCNRAFDACTIPLGPLGGWLRGPSGRRLLGLSGVTLIVLACGLVARDWFGWTW